MNIVETNKIAVELRKLGFKVFKNNSSLLWFGYKDYTGALEFRDENKNLCRASTFFSVWFEAGVNKNGVGDGKMPRKVLTYSLSFANHGKMRRFRCKRFDDAELFKFHNYSRNLKTLIEKFEKHLKTI